MIEYAEEIYTALKVDAEFMNLVGTYGFRDGTEEQAIVVLSSNEEVQGLEEVYGVEVVIARAPNVSSTALIAGCPVYNKSWRIYLIQYDYGSPQKLIDAADRLIALCPGASYNSLGTNNSPELAGTEQLVVNIPPHSKFIDLTEA